MFTLVQCDEASGGLTARCRQDSVHRQADVGAHAGSIALKPHKTRTS